MDPQNTLTIVDKQGRQGTGFTPPTSVNSADKTWIFVQFAVGQELWVPAHNLRKREDGSYSLDSDMVHPQAPTTTVDTQPHPASSETTVVPVLSETVNVTKRKVVSGSVRVQKVVHECQETVDELLQQETVKVERIAVDRFVDAPPENRYEGDTLIMPVVEEVLVVEKRLLLKEEVHIHKQRHEFRHQQQINVQKEEALIERQEKSREQ